MNLLDAAIQKPNIIPQANNRSEYLQNGNFAPIATTSLIKPDRPIKSRFVNRPFYMAPYDFVVDAKENIVNIGKGIKGKSNDHDLGRINDFALKAGALGLAGYLFTLARTPKTKAMEFIGFGAFFASMALWPKIFIQAPLKAMYGVDIHQKYKDNEGRTKLFFQDPQYIPWDLYTDKELSKLGDRLGIPKNIDNRNDLIKEKARKIALQGNTLWMLTAGFATPLFCALGCNAIEKIITPRSEKSKFPNNIFAAFASSIEQHRIDKVEADIKNSSVLTAKALEKYNPKELDCILNLNKGQNISEELVGIIADKMTHDIDIELGDVIKAQLDEILISSQCKTTPLYAKRLARYIEEQAKQLNIKEFDKLTEEKLLELLEEGEPLENYIVRVCSCLTKTKDGHYKKVLTAKFGNIVAGFNKIQKEQRILTPDAFVEIKKLDKLIFEYATKKHFIDKYRNIYLNEAAETVAATRWDNVAKALFESLGFDKNSLFKTEELCDVKKEGSRSLDLLLKKMDELAADDKKYEKAVRKVYSAILDFDRKILPDKANGESQGIKAILEEMYGTFFDTYAERFSDNGFRLFERHLDGSYSGQGSLRSSTMSQLSRRIANLRDGMYKVLHTLDFFRRTSDFRVNVENSELEKAYDDAFKNSEFAKAYVSASNAYGGIELKPTVQTFVKDLAEYKKIVLSATIADYTTKFGYKSTQVGLYDRMMKLIYSTNFADLTKKVIGEDSKDGVVQLGETTFVESFKKKIRDTLSNLGNLENPHVPHVKVKDVYGSVGDILVRDSMAGPRIDQIVRKYASNAYNSTKWLKMFGGGTAILVGITLLSETIFGRINMETVSARKDNQ